LRPEGGATVTVRRRGRAGAAPDEGALAALIRAGLPACGIDAGSCRPPADGLAGRLAAYLALLARWNAKWNLTAVRDPRDMVTRHLFDSLCVDPWVRGPRIVDVGTGAGLPGIPLALLRPGDRFTLLDSAGKRTRFLRHVVARLGLENVEVVQARVEDYDGAAGFDTVVSRAFTSVDGFAATAGHLCGPNGRLLAMAGRFPADDLAALPDGWRLLAAGRVTVPGLEAARHAVLLSGPERDGAP
jgi:16S rRNA (guanine527-N7)-methyltransferase